MKYRKLNNGDYVLGSKTNNFLFNNDAVVQAIKTSLLLLKGEWWEDIEIGLPLFQNILGQPGTEENMQAIDLIVRNRISNVEGVIDVKNYIGTYNNSREYKIECQVETIYGSAFLEVNL